MKENFMDKYYKAAKCRRRVNAVRFMFAAPAVSERQDKFAQDVANVELEVISAMTEEDVRALWNMDKADEFMREGMDGVCDMVCDYDGNVWPEAAREFLAWYCAECTPSEVIDRRGRNFAEAVLDAMTTFAESARRRASVERAEAAYA